MDSDYRHNHYVPVWYQKRFLDKAAKDAALYYLDLHPKSFTDPRGVRHTRRSVRLLGPKHCFAQRDLYTTKFGSIESTDIERHFFGEIDSRGKDAVDCFASYTPESSGVHDAFQDLILYLSTQKLRTPKGLDWLRLQVRTNDRNRLLFELQRQQQMFCSIWTECVWLIADATRSATKFIVSDHPVTIYNRECGPRHFHCRGTKDPDIRFHGSHTLFPLNQDKILILTNLSWVRNPYQSAVKLRPNPNFFRDAVMSFMEIQSERFLDEVEVQQINCMQFSNPVAKLQVRALREVWASSGWAAVPRCA